MRRPNRYSQHLLIAATLLLARLPTDQMQAEEPSAYQRELAVLSQRLNELFKERVSVEAGGKNMAKDKQKEIESLLGRRLSIDPLGRLQMQLLDDLNAIAAVPMDDEKERSRLMEFYREAAKVVVQLERPSNLSAAESLANRLRAALARHDLSLARRLAAKKEEGSR